MRGQCGSKEHGCRRTLGRPVPSPYPSRGFGELGALIGGPAGDRQVLAAWAKAHPNLWLETIAVLSAFIASEIRPDLHRLKVSDEVRAFHDRLLLRRELIIAEELAAPLEDGRQP